MSSLLSALNTFHQKPPPAIIHDADGFPFSVTSSNSTLGLTWSEKNPYCEEDRSFTFLVNVNTTTGIYGVSKINGVYEWKSVKGTHESIVIKDIISFTTFTLKFSDETINLANRTWDNIKNSSFHMEYSRLLP